MLCFTNSHTILKLLFITVAVQLLISACKCLCVLLFFGVTVSAVAGHRRQARFLLKLLIGSISNDRLLFWSVLMSSSSHHLSQSVAVQKHPPPQRSPHLFTQVCRESSWSPKVTGWPRSCRSSSHWTETPTAWPPRPLPAVWTRTGNFNAIKLISERINTEQMKLSSRQHYMYICLGYCTLCFISIPLDSHIKS